MADIQLPTTAATDTGTGALMQPYKMDGDAALYKEAAPSAQPGFLRFTRTEPKATKDYAGAARGEVKLTRSYADVQGRLWPAIVTVTSSLPAFLSDAQKTAFVLEAVLAARKAESQAVLAKLNVPQS